jgi:tetratricopeptide (TPR) repeat protein
MFQKDYIKRSFSFIQATLARLRGVALEGDVDVAREEITDAYSRVFGIPLSLLSLSPVSDIVDLLSTNEGDDAERILSLAELLKMDGEIYQKEGDVQEAQWRFDLSLDLLIAGVEVSNQPAADKILGLFEPIVRFRIQNQVSLERLAALYALYRQAGNYSLAKDLIIAFAETEGGKNEGIGEGTAFLSDLLGRADEELERGNITRQEIEEALETLEALRN